MYCIHIRFYSSPMELGWKSRNQLVDMTYHAFDVADIYRMPVMIMGDGMLGQMMEPVNFDTPKKRDIPEKTWATTGTGMKRKKNIINSLFIEAQDLEDLVVKRQKEKYDVISEKEVLVEETDVEGADIILTAYGTIARVCAAAKAMAEKDGIRVGIIRPITLWPFPSKSYAKAAEKVKTFLTVEMSMGQMVEDVRLAVNGKADVHFFGRTGGVVPTPEEVYEQIKKLTGGAK